jgi:hypothetical protein
MKGSAMKKISRRTFIKGAAVVGTAFAASPMIFVPKARASYAKKTLIHPNVDNLRVVGVTDPSITRAVEVGIDWVLQDQLVNKQPVWENIDRLACALTDLKNPEQAWHSIFIKPPRKPWSEAVVAIKTNHISMQHTRSAVMSKICHVLTDIVGVKAQNIHIYDACDGGDLSKETPFSDLPEGTRIENRWGGSNTRTLIPSPWGSGDDKGKCLKHLVDGSVDILVNISMCKGHSRTYGGFTMTMKNHFGTFSPWPGHQDQALEYLLAINKTEEILGSMDKQTGKILYPRQQLCLVDALWASKPGPSGNPTHQPNFLAMGVTSPIVDYVLATRFRGEKMGWAPDMEALSHFLTEFGYTEADLPNGGRILEI